MVRLSAKGKVKGEYRGVRMRNWGSWVCEIRISNSKKQDEEKGERIWLGSFDSSMKAALAYDFAAFYLRGTKAKLNFPQTPPPPSHGHHYPTKWQIKEAASRYANHMIATTMREEYNRKASQANRANSTWSRKNVKVPDSSSSTSASSNITKEEGTANQLNMDTDSTHHSDSLNQQHFDLAPLDDKAIEELCGFLRSHSNSIWWVL